MNTSLRNLGLSLFLAGLMLLPAPRAHACSCMPQTIEDAARSACAIFEGVVLAREPVGGDDDMAPMQLRVHMRVIQTWTAGLPEELTITTAGNSAACGYNFEVGRGYLVYADGGSSEAPSVSLCGGTKPREDADADIRSLGMGVVPVSPGERTATPSATAKRGGCAGCAVGSPATPNATSAMTFSIMTLALLCFRRPLSRSR